MDSGVLFGSKEMIEQRVRETAKAAKDMGVRHVMNLGHGIMQVRGDPERWRQGGRARRVGSARRGRPDGRGPARLRARGGGAGGRAPPRLLAGAALRLERAPRRVRLACQAVHRPARPPLTARLPAAPPPQGTPEENAAHFFKVAKELRYADL